MAREREYPGSYTYGATLTRLGVPTRLLERRVNVAPTPTEILSNNPRRLTWLITNRNATNGAIGFAYDLTFANGLMLSSNGGTAIATVEEDGELVGYPVYGVLEGGSGIFYVLEVIGL